MADPTDKITFTIQGTDTVIVLDGEYEFQVLGSDELGFFEALTSEHSLIDYAAPWSDPPLVTMRLPVDWRDYFQVVRFHCLKVGRSYDGRVEKS